MPSSSLLSQGPYQDARTPPCLPHEPRPTAPEVRRPNRTANRCSGERNRLRSRRRPGRLARPEPVQLPLKAPDRCEDVPQLAPEKHAASPPEPLLVGVERFQLPPRVSLRRCPLSSHEYGLVHADAVYPGWAHMSTVIWCGLLIM